MAEWAIRFINSEGKRDTAGKTWKTRKEAVDVINGIKRAELKTRGKISRITRSMIALRIK